VKDHKHLGFATVELGTVVFLLGRGRSAFFIRLVHVGIFNICWAFALPLLQSVQFCLSQYQLYRLQSVKQRYIPLGFPIVARRHIPPPAHRTAAD
jgi:hypothetical protein